MAIEVLPDCLIPSSFIYLLNSSLWKGGPLSEITVVGIPCRAKIVSSFGMTLGAAVDFKILSSGKRE